MIYQIFQQALQKNPNSTAIVHVQREKWSYAEANQCILQWAYFLESAGVKSNDHVMVLLNDEHHHVFIYLALDRINAIYVPLDTDHGEHAFSEDCLALQPQKIIVDGSLGIDYAISPAHLLTLDESTLYPIYHEHTRAPSSVYNENAAHKVSYIVASSGTTALKKWIPILGHGLLYWAALLRDTMCLGYSDKILATRSPAYDARIFEYVETFSNSSTLYLIESNQRKDIEHILTVCERESITSLLFIASQLSTERSGVLIQKLSECGLQHLLVTGDTCTPELKALCEKYSISLWNGYGPTEATFGLSLLCVNGLALYDDGEQTIVPIGKPWGLDVRYLIINQTLHIDSPYLTPGYLQMERNTSEWVNTLTGKNLVRWFNTNDVFSEHEGFLFYKGRSQPNGFCKVSGVKITTDPIEHLLNHYHLVNDLVHLQAAVVIKPYLGQLRPFAYVVVSPELDAQTSKAIQDHLRLKLKKEAIPLLVSLDALPRMPSSDKINRQALLTREDDLDAWFIDDSQTDEKSLFLETIRTIWQDVLRRENIPDNVEFLFLGGNSLDAQEMVRLIQKQIDPTYAYQQLLALKTVTIQAITQSLSHGNGSSAPPINQASIRALMIRPEASAKDNIFFLPALLGEGYFSYRELATVLSEHTKKSIYGLSDPSIYDPRLLPLHMGEAVQREIAAIKTIQSEGPYSLLGFSYGGTKAYYVAAQLLQDGECIENLYIMDSFPPMLYQALNASAHLTLLQPLLQFIVMTLTNSFYDEHIQLPKQFDTYATKAPSEQVTCAFSHLRGQLQNPLSHCALNLAEQHLSFLRNAPLPATKLSIWPTLYFTKRKQPYLNIINQVGLSKDSTDYRYFRWNHYFTDITRCGIELDCEHLGALDSSHRQLHQKGPEAYWTRPLNDVSVNSRVRPTRFFRVNQHTATHEISVFFLNEHTKRQFITQLDQLGLTARVFSREQLSKKHESTDEHFNTITSIFVRVSPSHQEAVYALLEQHHIKQKETNLTCPLL